MGMSSYYITIEVQNDLNYNDIRNFFERNYKVKKYSMPSEKLLRRRIVDNTRFVIDNKAVISIVNSQSIAKITFELCFSNYISNIAYIFNVCKWASSLGDNIKLIVLDFQYDFYSLSAEDFKSIIMKAYSKKYKKFNKIYGDIKFDILPQNFYVWVRKWNICR